MWNENILYSKRVWELSDCENEDWSAVKEEKKDLKKQKAGNTEEQLEQAQEMRHQDSSTCVQELEREQSQFYYLREQTLLRAPEIALEQKGDVWQNKSRTQSLSMLMK